jgi:nitrate/nitrite transporter NarK
MLTSFFGQVNALIAPYIAAEAHLSTDDVGVMTAAFLLGFAVFQVPLGMLLDRFGARKVQPACLLLQLLACLFLPMLQIL